MEKFLSQKSKNGLLLLGFYQIASGIISILIFIFILISTNKLTWTTAILYVIAFMLFAYSILVGQMCIKEKGKAIKYSLINQIIQTIGLNVVGFGFTYFSGPFMFIGLDLTKDIKPVFNLGLSLFQFHFNSDSNDIIVNVNIIAIIVLLWIDRIDKSIKKDLFVLNSPS